MRKIITIIVLVAAIGAGAYYYRQYSLQQQREQAIASLQIEAARRGELTATVGATGVVRSNQSALLLWQTSGMVEEITVTTGEAVEYGQTLASLKETSLAQNLILAKADLVNARKALENLNDTQLQEAVALQAVEDARNALENIDDTELQLALAEKAVVSAERALDAAQRYLRGISSTANQSTIDAAESRVVLALDALNRARDAFEPYKDNDVNDVIRATLQSQLATAQSNYDIALANLNNLKGTASQLDLAAAQADVTTAQAQLDQARKDVETIKAGPSEATLTLLQARLDNAEREYQRVKDGPDPDDVAAAEARIAALEAAIALAALEAPFNGVITNVAIKTGDLVNPGARAFQLDDLSRLLVDVEISEVDVNRIQVGQQAFLNFDAVLDKTYNGKVVEVGLVGSTLQGVVSFRVTIELLDPDSSVRPGMTAGVNIVVNQLENVLLVPNRAVRIRDGQRVVYLFPEGAVAPEPITIILGASSDVFSEIVGGDLKEGDPIVLNPPSDLSSFFGPPN